MRDAPVAIIGLGYVGLPLAAEFGRHRPTVTGFDIDAARITELEAGHDRTLEVDAHELARASHLSFTADPATLARCRPVFIVTVPTPITAHKQPDLTPLMRASETIGRVMSAGSLVIYESTVYPGATEEVCVPILERESGLTYNADDGTGFFCGYSPERINPGDKRPPRRRHRQGHLRLHARGRHEAVDALYGQVITAGTHLASSIRVAEAAKVIENTQRDLNIALVNELAIIFDKLGIDTLEVLEAAGTKWNFLPFRPGLVGGHCISVDPYYLTHKAQEIGHHPRVILAGREINDSMGGFVAERIVQDAHAAHPRGRGPTCWFSGSPSRRTARISGTRAWSTSSPRSRAGRPNVDVHDPWVDADEAQREYGLELVERPEAGAYDAVLLAVGHGAVRRARRGRHPRATASRTLSTCSTTSRACCPRHDVDARL